MIAVYAMCAELVGCSSGGEHGWGLPTACNAHEIKQWRLLINLEISCIIIVQLFKR